MAIEFSTAFTTPSSTILKNRSIEASPFKAFDPKAPGEPDHKVQPR